MPKALAIELTEADANVVQIDLSKKGVITLEHAFRVSFEGIEEGDNQLAEKAARLKESLKSHKVAAPLSSLVVPKQSTTVRKVRLPSADPAEIEGMAAFEAEKIIPFNVERHIIGYQVLGSDGIEGTDVLLSAIDGLVMEQYYGVVKGAGIDPTVADVSSLALAEGLLEKLGEERAAESFASVHVGWSHTDIVIFDEGEIVATRSVKHGVRNLARELATAMGNSEPLALEELAKLDMLRPDRFGHHSVEPPAETHADADGDLPGFDAVPSTTPSPQQDAVRNAARAWLRKLVTNIQRTYEFASREYKFRPSQRIYLSGEGALVQHLDESLQSQIGLAVEIFDPLRDMPRDPKGNVDMALLPAYSVAYGGAARVARTEGEGMISLLPPEVLYARYTGELRMHYAATALLALLAGAMAFLFFTSNADHRTEQYERYSEYTADLRGIAREFDDMRDRMNIIRNIRSEQAGALPILEAISAYPDLKPQPEGGKLTLSGFDFEMSPQGGGSVRITGYAMDIADIGAFVGYLEGMRNEDGVRMLRGGVTPSQQPTTLPRRNREVYRFEINAYLTEEAS